MKSAPQKLYKYVPFERWKNLENGYFRFTPPSELNDPFEMSPHFDEWMSDETYQQIVADMERESIHKIVDTLAQRIWDEMSPDRRRATTYEQEKRLLQQLANADPRAFKQRYIDGIKANRHALDPHTRSISDVANSTFGVFSLTRTRDNRPMWAHYADDYTGLVIEFDATHRFFTHVDKKSDFSGLREIVYQSSRPRAPYFLDSKSRPYSDLFFIKSDDWSYENEYRLVRMLRDAHKKVPLPSGKICHLFKMPPECVTGVIFGIRMEDANKDIIKQFLSTSPKHKHVQIYQSEQDERTFDLHAAKL